MKDYVNSAASHKRMEAEGWELLQEILIKANLTKEQWFCINLVLGFPVMAEKAQLEEQETSAL